MKCIISSTKLNVAFCISDRHPRIYDCKTCPSRFENIEAMKAHYMETHLDPNQLLELHLNAGGGDPDACIDIKSIADILYKCSQCNEIARTLDKHYVKHTFPRICEKCGKICHSQTTWRSHKKSHTDLNRNEKYACKICGKKYSFRGIKKHVKSHSDERPWVCEICGSAFKVSEHLRLHKSIHADIKKYTCTYCGKGFCKKYNLKGHLRTHSGEKPFKCKHCAESFTHNVSLKTHVKKAHGIDLWKTPESEISLHVTSKESDTVGSATSVDTLSGSATATMTSESSSSIGVISKNEKSNLSQYGIPSASKESFTPPPVSESSTPPVTESTTSTYPTASLKESSSHTSIIKDKSSTHEMSMFMSNIGNPVPVPGFSMSRFLMSNYFEGGASSSEGPPDEFVTLAFGQDSQGTKKMESHQ